MNGVWVERCDRAFGKELGRTLLHAFFVLLHALPFFLVLLSRSFRVFLLVPFLSEVCVACLCGVCSRFVRHGGGRGLQCAGHDSWPRDGPWEPIMTSPQFIRLRMLSS